MKECGILTRTIMVDTTFQKGCAEKTDEELAEESRKDEQAYACLMERYEKKLSRYIMRIGIFAKEDAEEILQETFLKTYENIEGFDSGMKFSSWIYRIAHNEAVSRIRHDASRKILFQDEFEDVAETIADEIHLEEEVDKRILSQEIRNTINTLDPKYKDVLVLRFLEHKDYNEISDILKKPPGTVATLLNRAKERLKKELEKNPIIIQP